MDDINFLVIMTSQSSSTLTHQPRLCRKKSKQWPAANQWLRGILRDLPEQLANDFFRETDFQPQITFHEMLVMLVG